MKRRNFLKAGSLLPLTVGGFGIKSVAAHPLLAALAKAGNDDRVFVVIQLNGGNDGLNTIIPINQYSNLSLKRSNILIPENKVLKLNGITSTGLNPAMTGLQTMYNEGLVNIIQSVGYPNPNFSHFRATDIWMTGSDANEFWTSGWLGRYLETQYSGFPDGYPNATMPDPLAIQFASAASSIFMGSDANMAMTISNANNVYSVINGGNDPAPSSKYGKELSYIRLVNEQTNKYTTVVKNAATVGKNLSTQYPSSGNNLSEQLKIVARLISGGLKTKIYMVSLGGFDTHSTQVDATDHTIGAHANLLGTLSTAIGAFQDDLKLLGVQNRVAGMTFSEFGRRIDSNASGGTDHGSAAPMIVFGTEVQSGIIGANPTIPSTTNANDNVPMQYDMRQIFTSVFQDWFGISGKDLQDAMGNKNFSTLPIFKNSSNSIQDYLDMVSAVNLGDPFPNPANRNTNVEVFSEQGFFDLYLYDPLGARIKTIHTGKTNIGKQQFSIDLSGLRPGNYYLQLSHGTKNITKVLVVQ